LEFGAWNFYLQFTTHMKNGFTVLEVIIVAGFTAIFMSFTAIFVANTRIQSQELVQTRDLIRDELIMAQSNTISGLGDTMWGVAFFEHSLTFFRGTNYASRNQAYDLNFSTSSNIVISGLSEINFTRPLGKPLQTGTITITLETNSKTISINGMGSISTN